MYVARGQHLKHRRSQDILKLKHVGKAEARAYSRVRKAEVVLAMADITEAEYELVPPYPVAGLDLRPLLQTGIIVRTSEGYTFTGVLTSLEERVATVLEREVRTPVTLGLDTGDVVDWPQVQELERQPLVREVVYVEV
jgi:hypothetical protein